PQQTLLPEYTCLMITTDLNAVFKLKKKSTQSRALFTSALCKIILFNTFFKGFSWFECRNFTCRNFNFFPCLRITSFAFRTFAYFKVPKADKLYYFALLK